MDVFWFAAWGAIADVCSSCLEVSEQGAGADLQPIFAACGPDFDVVLSCGREAQVACAHFYDSVTEAELPADVFCCVDQAFELFVGFFRTDELHHFYFVE